MNGVDLLCNNQEHFWVGMRVITVTQWAMGLDFTRWSYYDPLSEGILYKGLNANLKLKFKAKVAG